jgi:hypothetical protein
LLEAGWLIQNRDEINLSAARGIAIREFPMAAGSSGLDKASNCAMRRLCHCHPQRAHPALVYSFSIVLS